MENFIVRIYRRKSDDPYCINGVVEILDLNINKEFSSSEELFAILIPQENSKYTRRKQVFENRKYRRFAIKDCTLIFDSSTDVGEVVDISMGGLSFTCPDMPEESDAPFEVSLICGDDKFFVDNIQCKKMMNPDVPGSSVFGSKEKGDRCNIEFGDLTPKQRLNLEHIIQSFSHGEA
jgi:hypothetical protein